MFHNSSKQCPCWHQNTTQLNVLMWKIGSLCYEDKHGSNAMKFANVGKLHQRSGIFLWRFCFSACWWKTWIQLLPILHFPLSRGTCTTKSLWSFALTLLQKEVLFWNLRLCYSKKILFLWTQDIHSECLILPLDEPSTKGCNSRRDLSRVEEAAVWYYNKERAVGILQGRRKMPGEERGLLEIPGWQHLVILLVGYFHVLPNDSFMQNLWMVLGVGVGSKPPFPGQHSH